MEIKLKNKRRIFMLSVLLIIIFGLLIIGMMVKKLTIVVDGKEKVIYTFAKKYRKALEKNNVEIEPEDYISVDIEDDIEAGSVVYIKNAKAVTVMVDNDKIYHKTTKDTVGEVLDELNISYDSDDRISMSPSEIVNNDDNITITRITMNEVSVDENIAFDKKVVKDYKCYAGEERVIAEGTLGKKKMTYNVTYEDGTEVKRELISEEVISSPLDKIIGEGIFDPYSMTVCINKSRNLTVDFEPDDLVIPDVRSAVSSSRIMLRNEAASALERLFSDAEAAGIYLYAVSGYRSYSYQAGIYNPYTGYSAPPGASEHQLGLAMDVSTSYYGSSLTTEFAYTDEGRWLADNAHYYGFIIRYLPGKEDITGYYYEPWHIRYVGNEMAEELFESGETLEEYYGEY